MTRTIDDISSKGEFYDFSGVIRRLADQRGGKRQKGGIGVAGGCHAQKGVVHVDEAPLGTDGGKDG